MERKTASLRREIQKIVIIIALVPTISLNAYLLLQSSRYIRGHVDTLSENAIDHSTSIIEQIIDQVQFTSNQVISGIITSEITLHLDDRSRKGIESIAMMKSTIFLIDQQSQYVDNITVTFGGIYRFSSRDTLFSKVADPPAYPVIHRFNERESLSRDADGACWFVKTVQTSFSGPYSDIVISLRLNSKQINEAIGTSLFASGIDSFISVSNGDRIFQHSSNDLEEEDLPDTGNPGASAASSDRWYTREIAGSGLVMNMILPNSLIRAQIGRILTYMMLLAVLILLTCSVFAVFLSRSITKPLEQIVISFDQVGKGDFYHQIDIEGISGTREVVNLVADFNIMIRKIGKLVDDLNEKEKETAQAQLLALQAQVNPHFLYNTLDMIRGLAGVEKTEEIKEIAANLAGLFRYSIEGMSDFVALREELDAARRYMDIQRIRFNDRFHYDIRVADEYLEWRLPKLILQPLIENAYLHGLEGIEGRGSVTIAASGIAKGDALWLELRIEDTGSGIPGDRLREIRAALKSNAGRIEPRGATGGLGLMNIHRRLCLRYGNSSGVVLESREGRGTAVTISIPEGTEA